MATIAIDATRQIVEILAPFVGDHMARAALDAQVAKLRLDPERLSSADLGALANRLGMGLKAFVGPAKAEAVADAVRRLKVE